MSVAGNKLKRLLREAPNDTWALITFLRDGLGWPFSGQEPSNLDPEDLLLDWKPEELHLDPAKVAKVADIFQIPPFDQAQECGVFIINFTGGRLPIGAVRRVVEKLVSNHRSRKGTGLLPQWNEADSLIFFCLGTEPRRTLHVVSFRSEDGKERLRVLDLVLGLERDSDRPPRPARCGRAQVERPSRSGVDLWADGDPGL